MCFGYLISILCREHLFTLLLVAEESVFSQDGWHGGLAKHVELGFLYSSVPPAGLIDEMLLKHIAQAVARGRLHRCL